MPEFVENLVSHFEPLTDALARLDNKDKSTSEPPTREDVVSVLCTIDGEPHLEDLVMNGLNAAGPLFLMCVHTLVPMTLMRNPRDYAEKARRTPQNKHFKEDPTPCRMLDFILNSIMKRRKPVSRGSVWDLSDEEEEHEELHRESSRSKAIGRRKSVSRRPLPSTWDDEQVSEQEEEPISRRSRFRSTRRQRSRSPICSEEMSTQRDEVPSTSGVKRRSVISSRDQNIPRKQSVTPSTSKWRNPQQAKTPGTANKKTKVSSKKATSNKSTNKSVSSSTDSSSEKTLRRQKNNEKRAKETNEILKPSSISSCKEGKRPAEKEEKPSKKKKKIRNKTSRQKKQKHFKLHNGEL